MKLTKLAAIRTAIFAILTLLALNVIAAQNSKYVLSHSVKTSASPETIWALWADVENWKRFDTLLEYSRLEPKGSLNDDTDENSVIKKAVFESGTRGVIKADGAPKTRFKLLDVIDGVSFTERLYVPLYQVIDLKRRVAVDEDGDTVFTHEVHFKGRLRFFIHLAAAGSFKKELPLVMGRLKDVAEEIEKEQEAPE